MKRLNVQKCTFLPALKNVIIYSKKVKASDEIGSTKVGAVDEAPGELNIENVTLKRK